MLDLITLWKYTRMVVLVALIAAVYAAILIPFKVAIPLIPGFTEVRPANVIPVICSLMFGPAAAWGSAFGNLAGDIYGGSLGVGSAFGFVGNFLYGYLPYKLWQRARRLGVGEPGMGSGRAVGAYVGAAIVASAACAFVIAWGVDAFRMVPFQALGPIIVVNNAAVAIVLGPPLMRVLYPRVRRWGLLYQDIMRPEDLLQGKVASIGAVFVIASSIGGLVAGIALGALYHSHLGLTLSVTPFVALLLIGAALL